MIGVISDTHGLLRPEAVEALAGCDRIIHAGDVGSPDVLSRLRDIAPTLAVKGNVDRGDWASKLPRTEAVELEGHTIYVLHILEELDLQPAPAGISAVVYGHSHLPDVVRAGETWILNPGSPTERRRAPELTMLELRIEGTELAPKLVSLGT